MSRLPIIATGIVAVCATALAIYTIGENRKQAASLVALRAELSDSAAVVRSLEEDAVQLTDRLESEEAQSAAVFARATRAEKQLAESETRVEELSEDALARQAVSASAAQQLATAIRMSNDALSLIGKCSTATQQLAGDTIAASQQPSGDVVLDSMNQQLLDVRRADLFDLCREADDKFLEADRLLDQVLNGQ